MATTTISASTTGDMGALTDYALGRDRADASDLAPDAD